MSVTRIIANTFTGGAARIVGLVLGFVTTPMLVHELGDEAFGLFVIVGAIIAYVGLLDFGIGPGLVRHFAEADDQDDSTTVAHVMSLALTFYIAIAVLVGSALLFAVPRVVDLLSVAPELRPTAEISTLVVFGYFIISCLVGVLSARLVSLHRMDLTSMYGLFGQIAYALFVFLVLPRSPTVVTAILLSIAQVLIVGALSLLTLVRLGRLRISAPWTIPPLLVRKLMSFGGWMQLNSIASLISLETDKIVVASFTGISTVTSYQIGNRVGTLTRILPLQLLSAAMPQATAVCVSGSPSEQQAFYRTMTRYLMLLTVPVTGFVVLAAGTFITVWMGRVFPEGDFVAVGLSIAFAINNLTGVGTTMVRAAGRPKYESYCGLIGAGTNIALTVCLAPLFGLRGIVSGTIIAEVITSIFFLVVFHRLYGFSWWNSVGAWLWRLVAATAAAAGVVVLLQTISPVIPAGDRIAGLLQMTVWACAYVPALLVALWVFGFLTRSDLHAARQVFSKFWAVARGRL